MPQRGKNRKIRLDRSTFFEDKKINKYNVS